MRDLGFGRGSANDDGDSDLGFGKKDKLNRKGCRTKNGAAEK